MRVAGHTSRSGRVLKYPGRCAGVGLLLLRVTVGVTVALQACLSAASTHADLLAAFSAAALVVCGIALTIGLFTPFCSALVGLGYGVVLFTPFDGLVLTRVDGAAAVVGLAAATALALLGPGAFSIDCRLFGRREIFIRGNDRPE